MDDRMLWKTHTRLEKLDRQVRAALRWNDLDRLSGRLQSGHPADVADVIDRLPHPDQVKVFRLLAPAQAAEVLSETHRDATRELIKRLSPSETGALLDHLPMDDVAEILSEDVPECQHTLLAAMQADHAEQVQRLLAYAPQSAERLLIERFVRVRSEMTVAETLDALQGIDPEVETLADLYVLDDAERLVGVVSLRELVTAPREHLLRDIMTTQLVSVMPETDQEEVARLMASYNFVALPVTTADDRAAARARSRPGFGAPDHHPCRRHGTGNLPADRPDAP